MKRLIPAAIILIFLIILCVSAHFFVINACDLILNDVNDFCNQKITAIALENSWTKRKEQLALFVNHSFLDKISVYIGQLTLANTQDASYNVEAVRQNIQSIIELIKAEQKFAWHSFY